MRICVSLQMYVFLMHFILFFSSIFLFVMSYPGWLVSFYLLILSSFYFLCGCLYSNEIKKEKCVDLGRWGSREDLEGAG